MVYVNRKNIKTTRPSIKLDHTKLGPYKITKKLGPVTFELAIPAGMNIHPVFHKSLLEKAPPNATPGPVLIDQETQEPLYDVEDIVGWDPKTRRYLIKWLGYDPVENTWEPRANINPTMIKKYHQKEKPKPMKIVEYDPCAFGMGNYRIYTEPDQPEQWLRYEEVPETDRRRFHGLDTSPAAAKRCHQKTRRIATLTEERTLHTTRCANGWWYLWRVEGGHRWVLGVSSDKDTYEPWGNWQDRQSQFWPKRTVTVAMDRWHPEEGKGDPPSYEQSQSTRW